MTNFVAPSQRDQNKLNNLLDECNTYPTKDINDQNVKNRCFNKKLKQKRAKNSQRQSQPKLPSYFGQVDPKRTTTNSI